MAVNKKLELLRSQMLKNGIDAYVIPSNDPHQSEYVADHWQERAWISGFTGSAGTVIVTQSHAGVWTDSRYFLQAESELRGTEFELHKMYNQFASPYFDFLAEKLPSGSKVGINGWMFSKSVLDLLNEKLKLSEITVIHTLDLITPVWTDRPALSSAPVMLHDAVFTGLNRQDKIEKVREKMISEKADFHFISALDDIAWTFNMRGNDVDYNPVVICYAIIGKTSSHLFIDKHKLSESIITHLSTDGIVIHEYHSLLEFLQKIEPNQSILLDENQCSIIVYKAIKCHIKTGESIPKLMKAIKNETEISHIRNAMAKDGAAIASAFHWLEKNIENASVSEVDFANRLAKHRSEHQHYMGESFPAIIGYESNGAIIHYHPEPDTCKQLKAEGILLADSGGQYLDGTTDITRTIALGLATDEQKKHYTLILKGMIALSMARFPEGTNGNQLDAFARQFLWSEGLNYLHGTGHGVGFFLNVHEPPQGFVPISSERGKTAHLPGMLTSNEPGYYIEGKYGMRIENLILTVKSKISGFLEFETVTLYPFDHNLIDTNLLSPKETDWINQYHQMVFEKVSIHLTEELKFWFESKCKAL